MTFQFSRQGLDRREQRLERFFEILPGATSWAILLGTLLLSFVNPILAAVLVIAFDVYWLLRLFYMTFFLVASYGRLSAERETNWMARVHGVDELNQYLDTLDRRAAGSSLKQRLSWWIHRRELEAVKRQQLDPPPSRSVRHVVIVPILKERRAVIEPGIESLAQQTFPSEQILVVLALEERSDAAVKADVRAIQERYRDTFWDLLVVVHPDGLPNEARVKGANATYAAKAAAAYLGEHGIPFERVVVSCFDADTVVSQDYFACLTYNFLVCPERTRASFQPIPVYHNNIWEVPAFARVLDIGASFFQLIEATNPEKLVTFSSHSMSFRALVDVGYWPVDLVSDDSAIFWKAFIFYDGCYRVVPLSLTVSMDVAAADTWWKTATNVYKQKRRWAWGVENFPIVMRAFLKSKTLAPSTKLTHAFKLFEGHVAWATWAFLLTVIGWLPALFAGREFSNSILYYSAPRVTTAIFQLSSLVLVTTIILSFALLPKEEMRSFPPLKKVGMVLEWLFIPVITTGLGALPALDAQTRLMLGRYMEFWVADKRRLPRRTPQTGAEKRPQQDRPIVSLSESAYDGLGCRGERHGHEADH